MADTDRVRSATASAPRRSADLCLGFLAAEPRAARPISDLGPDAGDIAREAMQPGVLVGVLQHLARTTSCSTTSPRERAAAARPAEIDSACGRTTLMRDLGQAQPGGMSRWQRRRRSALCRDCLRDAAPAQPDRAAGLRLARASSRTPSSIRSAIAHVDCDAFYAAVEKRDDPEPRRQAGDHRRRQARRGLDRCYIARIYGVRSAMPMFKALKLCPEAVVIPPDMEKYVAVGREVRAHDARR